MNNYKLNDWEAGDFIRSLQNKLGVPHGTLVKIKQNPNGSGVIVERALTPAEKMRNWVNEELYKIPNNVDFMVKGKTVVAYWHYGRNYYSGIAICSPEDKFDLNTGKVIAWTRAKHRTPPNFIYE